jgi:hypothetical protein
MNTTKKIKKGGNNKNKTEKGGVNLPYINSYGQNTKETKTLDNISEISELNDHFEKNDEAKYLRNNLIQRSWHLPKAPQVKEPQVKEPQVKVKKFQNPPKGKPPIPDIKAANTTPDTIPQAQPHNLQLKNFNKNNDNNEQNFNNNKKKDVIEYEYSFVETIKNDDNIDVYVYRVNEAKKITEIAKILNTKKFKKYSVKKDETEKIVPELEVQVYKLSEDGLLIKELNRDENSADNNNDGPVIYSFVISTKNDETVSVFICKLVDDESDKIDEIVKKNINDETFFNDFKGYSVLKDENGKTVFKTINGGKKRKTFKRKTKIFKRKTFKKHKSHNRTTK